MLFSAVAQSYRCPECQKGYSFSTPTSFFPILAVIIFSSALWGSVFDALWESRLMALFLGFVCGIAIFTGLFSLIDSFERRECRKGVCGKCGAKLEMVGGGFVDGGAPSMKEILIYVLSLVIPLALSLTTSAANAQASGPPI